MATILVIIVVLFTIWRTKIIFNTFKSDFVNYKNLETVKDCDKSLWGRVYLPGRLYKINDCVKVTGVVRWVEYENDGDVHILVRLDNKYKNQINIFNSIFMGGNLVIEAVCYGELHDGAKEACGTYKSKLILSKLGDKVEVHGPFVIDISYGWSEIHPVSSIKNVR